MKEKPPENTQVTFNVDKEVLQNFRMAISKKHKGFIRGTTFIEFNEALSNWTKVMLGEAKIIIITKSPGAAFFDAKGDKEDE